MDTASVTAGRRPLPPNDVILPGEPRLATMRLPAWDGPALDLLKIEQAVVKLALDMAATNQVEAAKLLGITPRVLSYKLLTWGWRAKGCASKAKRAAAAIASV